MIGCGGVDLKALIRAEAASVSLSRAENTPFARVCFREALIKGRIPKTPSLRG
jgi:hypothetical protein